MTPQCETMLNHLIVNGSITGMDAINKGIMNYKGRIYDLRKDGYPIMTTMETRTNAAGERKTFAVYTLITRETKET